ncbi:arginase family protein [Anaerocellum danielii]|uniref:Arginase family protein n=1 Tax=Anaerocellum danielii TaxID=1387557 RepID=A0ABZ0U4Z6_9FIRM|nr:arginase family protein [Caldicellulosiruptor danielii]WPX09375.1 arginase family protein [Caldicellulosiruptor danielii]
MKSLLSSSYILMFDEYYSFQPRLKEMCTCIDFKDLPSTKYMCSKKVLDSISEKIKKVENSLFFLGAGEYHHFTYMLLKKINETFSLIVIDKHVDYADTYQGFITCGSWLKDAAGLNQIAEIFVLSEEKKNVPSSKIKIFPPTEYKNIKPCLPVYISIDKDILTKFSINTTWDQGHCLPKTLIEIVSQFSSSFEIVGADICGEPPAQFFSLEHKKSEDINLKLLLLLTAKSQSIVA